MSTKIQIGWMIVDFVKYNYIIIIVIILGKYQDRIIIIIVKSNNIIKYIFISQIEIGGTGGKRRSAFRACCICYVCGNLSRNPNK